MSIENSVRKIVADQYGVNVERIATTTRFDELNGDSLDLLEVAFSAEQEFDCDISDDQLETLETVADLIAAVPGQ